MTHPLTEICDRINIKAACTYQGLHTDPATKSAAAWTHYRWSVTLTCEGRAYTPPQWKSGLAHAKKNRHSGTVAVAPSVADIIASMVSDASCSNGTFEDFCGELGYDTDSRSALETYLACQQSGSALRRLLGSHYAAVCEAAQDY